MIGIIVTILVGFISIVFALKSSISLLRLKLGIYLLEKPNITDKGIYSYKIRVKNTGYRTIKIDGDQTLKLNFKTKVKVIKNIIKPKFPEIMNIKPESQEDNSKDATRLAYLFDFLNSSEYFDIYLKVKKISKVPELQFELRIPDLERAIVAAKYRFLRRFKLFIAKSMQIIGALYPILTFFFIFIIALIDKEILLNFAKRRENAIYAPLIYFFSHYLFLIIGHKMED